MLAESHFTGNNLLELCLTPLEAEMAVISEWIVREPSRDPDELFTVFVSPTSDGWTMQTACSCKRGTMDITCPHALLVIRTIRRDGELFDQLFRRNQAA